MNPDDEKQDKWVDDHLLRKDNVFHRKVSDVRYQSRWNLNESEALNLVSNPGGAQNNIFQQPQSARNVLTDDEIDRRAFFDSQTAAYNLRYILRTVRRELARSKRYQRPLSLCVVIIDNLLGVLQQYGVLLLENALTGTAETLIRSCRADVDMVGRYGEDRFLVLLPETPGPGAVVLSERIRKQIASLVIVHQWHQVGLTVSIGVTEYPNHGDDVEELIARADLAAEEVQARGGNGVCYAPGNREPA